MKLAFQACLEDFLTKCVVESDRLLAEVYGSIQTLVAKKEELTN